MALKIQIENPYNGISENGYVMIDRVNINNKTKGFDLIIKCYHSRNIRNNGKKYSFSSQTITFSNENERWKANDFYGKINLLLTDLYNLLKTKEITLSGDTSTNLSQAENI